MTIEKKIIEILYYFIIYIWDISIYFIVHCFCLFVFSIEIWNGLSARLNNTINQNIWSCSWTTCKHATAWSNNSSCIPQWLTTCLSLMRMYGAVSLSPAPDLSVFLIFYQGSDIYNLVEKKPGQAFFPSAFMESERKVVKPGASSYLAF